MRKTQSPRSDDGQAGRSLHFPRPHAGCEDARLRADRSGPESRRACELFGVEHGKQKVKRHGIVTPKYIDYNRRDVLATCELTEKLFAEYALHPIPLQVTKAYSPASIGKAYLRAMGDQAILKRMPDFPKRYLGLCGIGVLWRPCERACAQSSCSSRLHEIS